MFCLRFFILSYLFLNFNGKIFCSNVYKSESSYSNSIIGMEDLLKTELFLVEKMSNYADELEKRIQLINSTLNILKRIHRTSSRNTEAYLSNPLNSFKLMRRMYFDWLYWIEYFKTPIRADILQEMNTQVVNVPTYGDLIHALNGILRIQTVYDLKPRDIAMGVLDGMQYDSRLTILDSYFIANYLFENEFYIHALQWLEIALSTNFDEDFYENVFFININKIYNNYKYISAVLNRTAYNLKTIRHHLKVKKQNITLVKNKNSTNQNWCRMESKLKSLHCRYKSTTNAFLKLAPLKMEELSLNPYVVVFYDVLSETEIEHLKQLSLSNMSRVVLYNPETRSFEVSSNRFAMGTSLNYNDSIITRSLVQRVEDLTGLDSHGFELPLVVNYGIGGHFDIHEDFYYPDAPRDPVMKGDRIATVMLYLSDVEKGGGTVFPKTDVKVQPRKGLALVWYNLNNTGHPDFRTSHAACPVIIGSKWIMTVWITERSQFRTKPCFG